MKMVISQLLKQLETVETAGKSKSPVGLPVAGGENLWKDFVREYPGLAKTLQEKGKTIALPQKEKGSKQQDKKPVKSWSIPINVAPDTTVVKSSKAIEADPEVEKNSVQQASQKKNTLHNDNGKSLKNNPLLDAGEPIVTEATQEKGVPAIKSPKAQAAISQKPDTTLKTGPEIIGEANNPQKKTAGNSQTAIIGPETRVSKTEDLNRPGVVEEKSAKEVKTNHTEKHTTPAGDQTKPVLDPEAAKKATVLNIEKSPEEYKPHKDNGLQEVTKTGEILQQPVISTKNQSLSEPSKINAQITQKPASPDTAAKVKTNNITDSSDKKAFKTMKNQIPGNVEPTDKKLTDLRGVQKHITEPTASKVINHPNKQYDRAELTQAIPETAVKPENISEKTSAKKGTGNEVSTKTQNQVHEAINTIETGQIKTGKKEDRTKQNQDDVTLPKSDNIINPEGIKNEVTAKVVQVIQKEISSNQPAQWTQWQQHKLLLDDGKSLSLGIKQNNGVLHLQIGSNNTEMNQLLQHHIQDIKMHLQEHFQLEVDLQFQNSGYQGQGNNGSANQQQMTSPSYTLSGHTTGAARHEVISKSSSSVRLLGFNRNEWTG